MEDSDGGSHGKSTRSSDQGLIPNAHEEDVSEEEKMKAFFDLIQAARGARERLFFERKSADGDNNDRQRPQPAVWIPAFQASDFADDPGKDIIAKVPAEASGGRLEANPGKGEGKEERGGEGNGGGVNLKLSL